MQAVPVPSPAPRVPARRIAAGLCLTLLATVAVVAIPTVSAVAADPHPVAPTIHSLPLTGVDSSALSSQRLKPAAVADSDAAWTRETVGAHAPAVLTGQVKTAGFSAVGVTWTRSTVPGAKPPNLQVAVRTYDGSWQPWTTLEADADLPTAGSGEPGNGRAGTDPYFAGPSTGVQVRVDVVSGSLPADLRVELVDPGTSAADSHLAPSALSTASAAAGLPKVLTRAQWGADESLRNGSATYDSSIKMAFVHHTASSNSYTKAQAPAAVRSIYAYDTKGLGWSDIAYNVIVDKYGQVFEGRAGGLERAVRSAATGGFNPSTLSVSALGTYTTTAPTSAMLTSIERILAWKLGLYHLNPAGKVKLVASSGDGTTSRYANGVSHTFNVISGHRDAGLTACPGNLLYAKLPAIRSAVKKLMGAAILAPRTSTYVVNKGSTTPVKLTATAMNAQKWQLLVADASGHTVRTITGSAGAGEVLTASWNEHASTGSRVKPGVYTLTLSSWTSAAAAVPYIVNVSVDADPDVYSKALNGATLRLQGLGYGHGHGMSQFGAAGAAVKGLSAAQILDFYYPGTTLGSVSTATRLRVRLIGRTRSVAGLPDVRVRAVTGLFVSDGTRVLELPSKIGTATITGWRARLDAKGLMSLYGIHGSASSALKGWTGLATSLRFTRTTGAAFTTPPAAPSASRVSVYDSAGKLRTYRGTIEASRSSDGAKLDAVSDVRVDDYVRSVVSAELPGGWLAAAYQAQAVAARSYALYKQQHASSSARWDLVDSTADQVYLGFTGETSPESASAAATAGQYLAYGGRAAFTQYGSADGGWTSAGSQPYLPAKADPYDGVLTGTANWGHAWSTTVPATTIQKAWPAVGTLATVEAVDRDGHGSWGGRTTDVRIKGSKGSVTVSGTSFRSALGLKSEWWSVIAKPAQPSWPPPVPTSNVVQTTPSAPAIVHVIARDRSASVSWRVPADDGNSAITGYHLTVSPGGQALDVAASTHSTAVHGLVNGTKYTVSVSAKNAKGLSSQGKKTVVPTSRYTSYVPVAFTPVRSLRVRPGHPVSINVAGLPAAGVGAVSLRLSAHQASGAGDLRVTPTGSVSTVPTLRSEVGRPVVATAVVPTGRGRKITLTATRTMTVDVTTVGYWTRIGAVGQRIVSVTPKRVVAGKASANSPLRAQVTGTGSVPAGALGAWLSITASSAQQTTVKLPSVQGGSALAQLVVPAGRNRSTAVYVPLAANGAVNIAANHLVSLTVDVLGYAVADDGAHRSGRYQSLATPAAIYSAGPGGAHPSLVGSKPRAVDVLGVGGVPASGVAAVLVRVTVPAQAHSGWLRLGAHLQPSTRAVSFDPGATTTALAVVRPGSHGWADLTSSRSSVAVRVDVLGWWSS